MARFDVYLNTGKHAKTTPYLLDIQSDLLDELDSRVVIPLRRLSDFPQVRLPTRLTPIVAIEGKEFIIETPKMGAVPRSVLKSPISTLADEQTVITAALDFLFQGY
ncbi:toxin CcdB [Ectothiorhodosinus mongolicus]|uniref:Toxin CcdB n=1 Tax=Ectothiorhodosinus mongolicus TaxID=233100 RepID=A0A1R3VUP6_9GAMM|nr:CcdB family protein [Ectothiorhodosinus mongolicus]ULX56721.1 plasmid maintenance protein CcdB [Ectothiorhodosinus mongolicus]SIT66993.1 toxin CcdB [Ectothiorhodosinus mongolicus]